MNSSYQNMSMAFQSSLRPSTLPLGEQYLNNTAMFTPNINNNIEISTPEILNQLTNLTTPDYSNAYAIPMTNSQQNLPVRTVTNEQIPNHNGNNTYLTLQTINSFDPIMHSNTFSTIHDQAQEDTSTRSMSATSFMDNESSNSTAASSPLSTIQQSKNVAYGPEHASLNQVNSPQGVNDFEKKEKKRERNRQAAQKCRTRKLTRIAELQQRVNELQGKNKELYYIAENLKSDILNLEKRLNDHQIQGCALTNGVFS